MVERFPTILRDKDHMILAVPLGMTESFAVWHDKLPLGGTLSGSPKGVCRLDSRNCQTLGVPRQSRGFTMIKLLGAPVEVLIPAPLREQHVRYRRAFWAQPAARRMGIGRDPSGRRKDGTKFPI